MAQGDAGTRQTRMPLALRVILLGVMLNVPVWLGASAVPGAVELWKYISLLLFFLMGAVIGHWWALLVTCAFGVIHAVPVYLGWLPGYLSTWGEALWWAFALALMSAVTALGVLTGVALRRARVAQTAG